MVEWAATAGELCGFGERGTVRLDTDGWHPGGDGPELSTSVDAAAVGTTTGLRLPSGAATLVSEGRSLDVGPLPAGTVRIAVDAAVETHLAFEGPATVERAEGLWLRFPGPTAVTVGFREDPGPRPELTVPATPSGLASAVTAAGRTHRTAGPERSHPGLRSRTPTVRFGERSVPDHLDGPGDGPTMTVPDSVVGVLVAAPLAYYVGAELRTGDGQPEVRGDGLEHTFEPLPTFASDVVEALRSLCDLDSRLRSIPGESGRLLEGPEAERLQSASPARRLAAALESPPEALPEWPLSTYVDEDVENGRYLPYLLDRLSLVHPARSSSLDPQSLLKRSLDEFYRGDAPNVDAVDPTLADSRSHAWLGDGTPVDAYTLLGSPSTDDHEADGLAIDVICNEPEMASEEAVAEVYRDRLEGLGVDIRVHERLSTGELASTFQRPTDLVHFIGHCEVKGMVCPDGPLAASDLEECRADSFFLNACGSYYEGYDLVQGGATVGAVTLSAVLDEQAVTVGTTFAELLAEGFAFDRALSLARGEIISGQDYVVVGDGTHRLRPPRGTPAVIYLQESEGTFTLRYDATAPGAAGKRYLDPLDGSDHLCGETTMATLDAAAVRDLLASRSVPVRYDGALHWSNELANHIAPTGQQS